MADQNVMDLVAYSSSSESDEGVHRTGASVHTTDGDGQHGSTRSAQFFAGLTDTARSVEDMLTLASGPRQMIRRQYRPTVPDVDPVQLLPHHGMRFFTDLPQKKFDSLVGLRISEVNCPDIRYWHDEAFTTVLGTKSYKTKLLGIQQYARIAIALDDNVVGTEEIVSRLRSLGQPMGLCKMMTGVTAVQFAMFFCALRNPNHVRCTMYKAIGFMNYWVKGPGRARLRLREDGDTIRQSMLVAMSKLRNFAKDAQRRANALRVEVLRYETRVVKGHHLQHGDYLTILAHIRREVQAAMALVEVGGEVNQSARRKVLSVLEAGVTYGAKGQRRQVLVDVDVEQVQLVTIPKRSATNQSPSSLEVHHDQRRPTVTHAHLMDDEGVNRWLAGMNSDEVRCVVRVFPSENLEKRERLRFYESFSLRAWLGPLLVWYFRHLRPRLVERWREQFPEADEPSTLLLHSETGMPIGVRSYASVLRYYANHALGQDHPWTPTFMNLRRSHATNKYVRWYDSPDDASKVTVERFLEELARQMNTSPKQLVNHYIASYGDRFLESQVVFEEDEADFESDLSDDE